MGYLTGKPVRINEMFTLRKYRNYNHTFLSTEEEKKPHKSDSMMKANIMFDVNAH